MNVNQILKQAQEVKEAMDKVLEHQTDWDDTIEPEANTPDGLIPNSWVDESGVRHATIWEAGLPSRMRVIKSGNGYVCKDIGVF